MIIATNYADKKFKKAQKLNSKTARAHGADNVIEYGPEDIDRDFYEKNKEILSNPRGGGYYLWKPYFYRKAYDELNDGFDEVLEYAQDIRCISDNPNVMGQPNYDEFIAHRHDQAIISLMSKKYNIKRFRDPSQFGLINHYEPEVEARSLYPQIVDSHRFNAGSVAEIRFRRTKPVMFITKNYNRIKNKISSRR